MDSLFQEEEKPARISIPEYSVSEISNILKRTVEDAFSYVKVRGEISGLKPHSSGHMYFNLKDNDAVMATVCWKGVAASLLFRPEDGMEVICTGKISTYPARSNYQLIVSRLESAGVGALLAMLEKRKAKFAQEGLFDPERKKALPLFPQVIGIVTSPTGAVIRDILHRIKERFPVHVIVWPVAVQGSEAASQIAAAIRGFNGDLPQGMPKPDLLIIARGGGSIEDLWPFNEEIVVRAAAESSIPLISAVGHETDTTLIDYVSDLRAPTPTAAAEIALKVRFELNRSLVVQGQTLNQLFLGYIQDKESRILHARNKLGAFENKLHDLELRLSNMNLRSKHAFLRLLQNHESRLKVLAQKLNYKNVIQQLDVQAQKVLQNWGLVKVRTNHLLHDCESKLMLNAKLLESYHYKKVLQRGYALVWDNANNPLTNKAAASKQGTMRIEFNDGKLEVLNPKIFKKTSKLAGNCLQEELF